MNYKNLGISGLGISGICLCSMNFKAPPTELFPAEDQYYAQYFKMILKIPKKNKRL